MIRALVNPTHSLVYAIALPEPPPYMIMIRALVNPTYEPRRPIGHIHRVGGMHNWHMSHMIRALVNPTYEPLEETPPAYGMHNWHMSHMIRALVNPTRLLR